MKTSANRLWKSARRQGYLSVRILTLITLSIASNRLPAATVRYVNLNNSTPTAPYTNWATASRTIQTAIDASVAGDEIRVTNGIYQTGGLTFDRLQTNRVALNKPILVRSVNGPNVTVIEGKPIPSLTNQTAFAKVSQSLSGGTAQGEGDIYYGGEGDSNYGGDASSNWYRGTRCAFVGNGAVLSGFTLADGSAQSGGGVLCDPFGVVTNCVLTRNFTVGHDYVDNDGLGGGGLGGTFYDCLFYNNTASSVGGGVARASLFNCIFVTNSALNGGAVYASELWGCRLQGNRAERNCPLGCEGGKGGGASQSVLHGCTLEGNAALSMGGGAVGTLLDHCLVLGNAGEYGGGLAVGFAKNCVFVGNHAALGGAASGSPEDPDYQVVLVHCTVTGNSASSRGGGVFQGSFNNCILYNNHAPSGENFYLPDYEFGSTDSLPDGGVGNFYDDPLFVDESAGDYRLEPDSPCVNAGNNDVVMTALDLDGNPRISGDIVDSGAYEFVLNPRTSLQRLALLIQHAALDPKEKQPLSASLNAAAASFESGNSKVAINLLSALENKLSAQISLIHPEVGSQLMAASELAIELIAKH